MSQKRLRSDSAASTDPNTWTIFEPSSAPDADGDIIPTNPHDTKHSRHAVTSAPAITCFLPPSCAAGTAFASHELFESHYAQAHTNRCLECGKNFPSGRFLELHIAEHHDPLQELRRERGEKGYGCFVEGCERFCSTPQKRRRHVIDKHHFPKEYNWGIVQWGIDNHTTLLTRSTTKNTLTTTSTTGPTIAATPTTPNKPQKLGGKNPSPKQKDPSRRKRPMGIKEEEEEGKPSMEKGKEVKEVDMLDVANAMSAMKLVPPSVRFGGRRGASMR
ncbi:uncharacterized protein H6S33_005659 [Morchella sextelata]|uniref:uncharacterized protein n=1 Tax=Morchella sextelata TaxID=1174677 RepID=UPI001D0599BA|nr:uncharacterized protein H6S33_005659 [Morchella sextelata]KAH0613773.1 hypothetical protein H6S33_005659 [Morchella sextelata]